jgi:hypothetical protein
MTQQVQTRIKSFSGVFITGNDEAQPGQSGYAAEQVNAKSQMPGRLDIRQGVRPITYDLVRTL